MWTFGIDPQQQIRKILDFVISAGNKNIGFLLPDNSYGYLLYDTIEKVLNKNNLFPARVEFFKDDIESQRQAANKISRGFKEYEEDLRKIEEDLEKKRLRSLLINNQDLKKPLDSIFIGASGQTLTILASQLQYSSVDPKKVSYVGTSSWEDAAYYKNRHLNEEFLQPLLSFCKKDIKKLIL